jgi:hypothetical protein
VVAFDVLLVFRVDRLSTHPDNRIAELTPPAWKGDRSRRPYGLSRDRTQSIQNPSTRRQFKTVMKYPR